MMRKPLSALGLSITLLGCSSQQPAAAPLAAPPPAAEPAPVAVATPPVETPKEAPKPVELTQEQTAKLYQDCWTAFNAKDWAKFSSCFADNATSEQVDMGMPVLTGKDVVDKGAKTFAAAFPDVTGEAQLTLVNGSHTVGVWLLRGTNKGPMQSPKGEVAATNKKVGFLFGHSVETKAGKAVHEAGYYDAHTMLGQLGLAPGPVRKVQEQGGVEKPTVLATNSDAEKANVETYRKYADAFSKKDAPALDALLTDDFTYSDQTMPADLVGKKEAQKGVKEIWKGMSDAKLTIATSFGAGDYVASTIVFTGTNDGPIPSMKLYKKTGKKVALNCLSIAKVSGGKLKQEWVFANGMLMADQLGLIPPAKDAKAAPAKPGPEAKKEDAGKAKPAAPAAGATPAAASPKPGATPATPATPAAPKAATPATPATPAAPKAAAPAAPKPAAPAAPAKPATPPAK